MSPPPSHIRSHRQGRSISLLGRQVHFLPPFLATFVVVSYTTPLGTANTSRCLFEIKEWDECLEALGGMDPELTPALLAAALPTAPSPPPSTSTSLDYLSAIFLLRAQVYDSIENFPRAVQWYIAALLRDPFCYEAFQALVERHKITVEEESSLVDELSVNIPKEQKWLALLYRAKTKQYDPQGGEKALEAVTALDGGGLDGGLSAGGEYEEDGAQEMSGILGGGVGGGGGRGEMGTATATTPTTRSAARRAAAAASVGAGANSPSTARSGGTGARAMAISPISEEAEETMPQQTYRSPSPQQQQGVGVSLRGNADVAAAHAEILLRRGQYREAFNLTSSVLETDQFSHVIIPPHLAACVALGKKHELFSLGHALMKNDPHSAVSWYAAGCFYFLTEQYPSARHYFAKATSLDKRYAPAWIGFAKAFAAQDETDQAMAAFRTAARLFPGLHQPLIGMGLEYVRMNNMALAEQTLLRAYRRCPVDPAVAHELGTIAYKSERYEEALQWLTKAWHAMPKDHVELWEPTVVNLGHALRKLKRYEEALEAYRRGVGANPEAAGTYTAMAYTYHLMGDVRQAVELYHKALGLRPEDDFAGAMLSVAVGEDAAAMTEELTRGMDDMLLTTTAVR